MASNATQTPLEQLTEMNERVGKTRRRSARPRKNLGKDVERFYRAQLRSLVRAISKEVEAEVVPIVKQEKTEYLADSDTTSPQHWKSLYIRDNWADRVIEALRGIAGRFTTGAFASQYERLAARTVSMAESESTSAFVKSVNQAVGVDMTPMMTSEGMADYIQAAAYQNSELIKSVPADYLKRVENAVIGGIRDGEAPTTISRRIRESTGVTKRQADRIARDQTAKLTSEITERRQTQAGIKYYKAVDAGDERVTGRPGGKYPKAKISCWGIARQDIGYGPGVYRWDQGASWGGQKGLHPGRHHPQCRCTASPIFEWELPKK